MFCDQFRFFFRMQLGTLFPGMIQKNITPWCLIYCGNGKSTRRNKKFILLIYNKYINNLKSTIYTSVIYRSEYNVLTRLKTKRQPRLRPTRERFRRRETNSGFEILDIPHHCLGQRPACACFTQHFKVP